MLTPPKNAVRFDVTTFGQYTPRGFDPARVSGKTSGVGIENWPGKWAENNPGARVDWRDASGAVIGFDFIPSR